MEVERGVQVTRRSYTEVDVEGTNYKIEAAIRDGFLISAIVIKTVNDEETVIVEGFW